MRKLFVAVFLLLTTYFLLPVSVFAITDPTIVPNNRFGIHILDENDLESASNLVNSNGGQWGYVTFVIREDERDTARWQRTLDKLRELKLIPIVRIATSQMGENWRKPTVDDVDSWANFLGSLTWVSKNRYIILFNEPNHAKEWEGVVDPGDYAQVAKAFIDKLKEKSPNFFVMPAGLDLSAPNSSETLDASIFYYWMDKTVPGIFGQFDGLASHSYPNPNFSADVTESGRKSIRGYEWELSHLSQYGLKFNSPIFITETGWSHAISEDKIAKNFVYAYQNIWNNPQIVTVTPFILKYIQAPFDDFSWIKPDSTSFYKQYEDVVSLKKIKGEPEIVDSYTFIDPGVPSELIAGSQYSFTARIKNTGEALWNRDEYALTVESFPNVGEILAGYLPKTKPNEEAKIEIRIKTPQTGNKYKLTFVLTKNRKAIGEKIERTVTLTPPVNLNIETSLLFKRSVNASDFTLLLYEDDVKLVKKIDSILFKDGRAQVSNIRDIVPDKTYRFVLLKPFYLPSQTHAYFDKNGTSVTFPNMWPFDLNSDGKLSPYDLSVAILHPVQSIKLWLPF